MSLFSRLSAGAARPVHVHERPPLFRLLWEFVRRDTKIALSYRFQTFFQFAGLFSMAVTFFFMSLMMRRVEGSIDSIARYGGSYFAFALIGIAVTTYMDSALRTFALSVRSAQMTGTFEAMLTTRASVGAIVAGSAAYTVVYTWIRAVVIVMVGVAVFGMQIHTSGLPALALVLVLTGLATMALGIMAAGFIVLFNKGDPITAAISGLSWLLSGVVYPREILPHWVQQLSLLLPMTHSLEAARRTLLVGDGFDDVRGSLFGLVVFIGIGFPASLLWFQWSVKRARSAGSLARY